MQPLLYAEQLPLASDIDLGQFTLSRDDIVQFATQWDPQAFHIDDEAAQAGFFGGLIASGLQTMGVLQRLAVLNAFRHWHVIAGRAIRDVQLTLAVRPGMQLDGTLHITAITPVDDTRSLVTKIGRLHHEGRPVLSMESDSYVRRAPA
jgi:acyl dehydratase